MANYRAVANGNWSAGATWGGGAVPPNGEGHNIYSNNFTVTIDQDVNVALIANAGITGTTFVGGGTSATAGGTFPCSVSATITGNIRSYENATASTLTFSGGTGVSLIVNGNVTGANNSTVGRAAINKTGAGTLTVNGNIFNNGGNVSDAIAAHGIVASAGITTINGNITTIIGSPGVSFSGGNSPAAVLCTGTANLFVNSGTITGGSGGNSTSQTGILQNSGSSVVTLNNCIINAGTISPAVAVVSGSFFSNNGIITAANGVGAVSAGVVNAFGTFVYSQNGTNPIGGARLILGTTPTNAYAQFALNGINSNSFVRFYTSDNNLGQANPTDVRSGVSYASGSLTGRLTVPARGSVALSVNYGPSMPFTATRSGTTATATMAYSYPLVVDDQITVTGASNSEWNGNYTIASVVSGTSVTFTVPNTHGATAGTGAVMQTTGTAVLDPASIATAVQNALTSQGLTSARAGNLDNLDAAVSSRLAPSGTLATVTTLTNAPTVPTPSEIASQVRTELTSELSNLDASISSRLAGSAYTAPSTPPTAGDIASAVWAAADKTGYSLTSAERTAIATAVEGSLLNENDGQAVLNAIVGAIGNTNLSEVSLVAAVRADLERSGGKLDSIPTTAAPTAAQNATAVWGAATKEITGGTVTNLTNAPASVTPTDIWSHATRTLTSASGPTAIEIRQELDSNSTQLSAIKSKTDALPSDPADQSLLEAAIAGVTAPSAATVASAVRSELSVELARVDQAVSSRLAASEASKLDAVKAKTDLLQTDRLAQCSTVATTGAQLAAALS